MKRTLLLLLFSLAAALASQAQQALDFAKKFMTLCEGDTAVRCITVSPKMMEQIVERHAADEQKTAAMSQAISKLKSARIVTAPAEYYGRAEQLIKKHARRFKAEQTFESDHTRGTFYTRQTPKGTTAELIMLREDIAAGLLTVICLTGRIDKEFLCFLYNNKSLKD